MSSVLRVYLSAEDRQRLLKLTRSGHASARLITRAQILLLVDRNQPAWKKHREVVIALQPSLARISRVSRRYVLEGLDAALSEELRSSTPPKITRGWQGWMHGYRFALPELPKQVRGQAWLAALSLSGLRPRARCIRSLHLHVS